MSSDIVETQLEATFFFFFWPQVNLVYLLAFSLSLSLAPSLFLPLSCLLRVNIELLPVKSQFHRDGFVQKATLLCAQRRLFR